MAFTRQQLFAKAQGTVSAFERLTARQREQEPPQSVVDDYNSLRTLVLEAEPGLEKVLPPRAEHLSVHYQDIHAFSAQIAGLMRPTLTGGPEVITPRFER